MRRTKVLSTIFMIVAIALSCASELWAQPIKWTTKAPTPIVGGTGRRSAMSFIIGSKVYVGGGYIASFTNTNEFYAYDTATNIWSKKKDLPAATSRSAGIAFSINGKGYVGLGSENYLDIGGGAVLLADLWEYDPTLDTWMARAPLPDTGRASAACFVVNNKAYVVGGEVTNTGFKTTDVWEYDPVANAWAAKASFPLGPVGDAFSFSLGSGTSARGYISCGSVSGVTGNKKTYAYDPVANSWTAKADYPGSPIKGGFSVPLNGKAYCGAGGLTYNVYSDTFYAFDPVAGTWSAPVTSFPGAARGYGVAVSFGKTAFLGGGWTYGGGETFYQDWYKLADTSVTVGVAQVLPDATILLRPNPANNFVYLDGSYGELEGDLRIYDLEGKLCTNAKWTRHVPVDISALPNGLYVLMLATSKVYCGQLMKY